MRLAILGLSLSVLVMLSSCAGVGAELGTAALDCTERTASEELCTATTSALSLPEAAVPATGGGAPAAGTSWESALGTVAKGAVIDELGCLVQAVALGQMPTSGGCTPSAPSPGTSPLSFTSAAPTSIHIAPSNLAAARPLAPSAPAVSDATVRSRAKSWLARVCPAGHCTQPVAPPSVR